MLMHLEGCIDVHDNNLAIFTPQKCSCGVLLNQQPDFYLDIMCVCVCTNPSHNEICNTCGVHYM